MIISQQVFADNIKGTYSELVDKARVDGTMYGDTKLYYATDALSSHVWGADAEATNLLTLHRPAAPECQAIVLDQFRQIDLTVDNYLSKRAWSDASSFGSFNSVMLGWMRETKRIYDATLYNSYIGTTVGSANKSEVTVDLSAFASLTDLEAKNRLEAQTIAQNLADLLVEMKDVGRDFNDYKFLRSYASKDIKFVWNSKWVNKITKVDLPTIFNSNGLVDKFEQYVLPSRYFGNVIADVSADSTNFEITGVGATTYKVKAGITDVRSLIEADFVKAADSSTIHLFPGDVVPAGYIADDGETYKEDATIICKVVTKLPPYMSAFEVGTSFYNPKSLTENHYLTFGYNTLDYLANYPFVSVEAKLS